MSILQTPGSDGRFGEFGGRFVPETLVPACQELEHAFSDAWNDPMFRADLDQLLREYAGRPSMVTECHNLGSELGIRLFLKREDLNHTGSHKINNVLGQVLLAKRMGKKRIVAETGAGQHGVASATAAALLGLECKVYMGEVDTERQELNVFRMRLLGAEVEAVTSGSRTLKDAVNEAMRDWVASVETTHYCLGSVMGPHPYPFMVRQFHRVIGDEAFEQMNDVLGTSPDYVVACVGGGSNAMGIFSGFVDTPAQLIGVEPAGGAAVGRGQPGVVHGMKSYLMQDEYGQVSEAHSISAGLDYPGVGPEHSYLASIGRAQYPTVTDDEVIAAFQLMARSEGIIPALECAHAMAWISREAPNMQGKTVLMNLSGRGDKDVGQMMSILGDVI
ncbi:MAG: tryptophan synthase subunit beta [Actinobacteria bacterium]|uniref:tryptophan synthase n=1 Tax=freshwater metagenome TaxID=449393 RepID=A0A6J7SVM6_9ZZZZ|nr:tryptophan synthase subunit beta [Actinomycetota bacterium]MSZ59917.1 tryptophan synthase subunit beta [Actinomycetota bacterium]MTB11821.1 tryptophan synthase subunit beta [Actinomycetota bacterium]